MPKLLLIGHSHIACFTKAASELGDENVRVINLRKLKDKMHGKKNSINALKEASGSTNPSAICLCLRGNDHNIMTILEHPDPFIVGERESRDQIEISSDRWFIPYNVMISHLRKSVSLKISDLSKLIFSAFPDCQRFYIPPPPPISDWEHIKKNPGIFQDKIHLGPAPLHLKKLIYSMQLEVLNEIYDELDAKKIDVDHSVTTEEGFLLPSYFNDDPTHANANYGRAMMKVIMDKVGLEI